MSGLQGGAQAGEHKMSEFSCKWVGMYSGKGPDEVSLGESESRGGEAGCRAGVMMSCLLAQLSWQQSKAGSNRGRA